MPQPFLSFSLQSFPLTKIVVPSRGHQLPCGYPPDDRERATRTLSPAVSPTPTPEAQLPGSPTDYGLAFSSARRPHLPLPLGHPRRGRPRSPASPASKPYSLRESVRTDAGCPTPLVVALLGSCPSNDPPKPRILRPARARRPEHLPQPGGPGKRPRGPAAPQSRVKPNPTPKRRGQLRRQSPVHFWTGPRRLSATTPSPLTFQPRAHPQPRPSELRSIRKVTLPAGTARLS